MKCMNYSEPIFKEAAMTYEVEEKLCYAEPEPMIECEKTEIIYHKELTCSAPVKCAAEELLDYAEEEICEEAITYEMSHAVEIDETVQVIQVIENELDSDELEKIKISERRSSIPTPEKPKEGIANAARVSRGSEEDTWNGLTVESPIRNEHEHLTISVVIYFTVAGGVPSEKDVLAAIDDMEMLYNACNSKGRLADEEFDFMKKELTVKDVLDINKKITEQPIQSKNK